MQHRPPSLLWVNYVSWWRRHFLFCDWWDVMMPKVTYIWRSSYWTDLARFWKRTVRQEVCILSWHSGQFGYYQHNSGLVELIHPWLTYGKWAGFDIYADRSFVQSSFERRLLACFTGVFWHQPAVHLEQWAALVFSIHKEVNRTKQQSSFCVTGLASAVSVYTAFVFLVSLSAQTRWAAGRQVRNDINSR